jgi:hypothetical protein
MSTDYADVDKTSVFHSVVTSQGQRGQFIFRLSSQYGVGSASQCFVLDVLGKGISALHFRPSEKTQR